MLCLLVTNSNSHSLPMQPLATNSEAVIYSGYFFFPLSVQYAFLLFCQGHYVIPG